jgi:hypothetical protein
MHDSNFGDGKKIFQQPIGRPVLLPSTHGEENIVVFED